MQNIINKCKKGNGGYKSNSQIESILSQDELNSIYTSTSFLPTITPLIERCYNIDNDIKETTKCSYCNSKKAKFESPAAGYNQKCIGCYKSLIRKVIYHPSIEQYRKYTTRNTIRFINHYSHLRIDKILELFILNMKYFTLPNKQFIQENLEMTSGGLIKTKVTQLEELGIIKHMKMKYNIKSNDSIEIIYNVSNPNDITCNTKGCNKKPQFKSYKGGYRQKCIKCNHMNKKSIRNVYFGLKQETKDKMKLQHFRYIKHLYSDEIFPYFMTYQFDNFVEGGIIEPIEDMVVRLKRIRELGTDSNSVEKYNLMYGDLGTIKRQEAIETSNKSSSLEGYIEKYGIEEGTKVYNDICKSKDSSSLKAHIKRYGEELGPIKYQEFCDMQKINTTLEYQIEKYGKEEGTKRYHEFKQRQYINSNTTLEYYLTRGYPIEEALIQQSKRQSTFSKEKCIEKYGEEQGLQIWQDRQDKWQETLLDKPQEEIDRINKSKNPSFRWICEYFNLTRDEMADKLNSIDIEEFKAYNKEVFKLSNDVYLEHIDTIDPDRLRGYTEDGRYHLDHKFSRLMGYLLNVPSVVMACKHNLEILTEVSNITKNCRCSIKLEELANLFKLDLNKNTI